MADIASYLKEQVGLEIKPERTTSVINVYQALKLLM